VTDHPAIGPIPVTLTLTADGGSRASLIEPAGIGQTTLTKGIPVPYDR
jgi:hypothetical protein